jgi:hypothetical protein
MRTTFLLLFSACSLLSYSQNDYRGYFAIEPSLYFNKKNDPAFGVNFSGSGELANGLFAGLQVGIVSFDERDKVYVPLQAKFTVAPGYGTKKTSILIFLEPGFGVYQESFKVGNDFKETTGGFTFFGGLGAAFPGKRNSKLSLVAGYSLFGFKTEDIKSNTEMFGMRLGLMF